MKSASKVLLTLAIVVCVIEIAVLANDLIEPQETSSWRVDHDSELVRRTLVYWGSGILVLLVAGFALPRFPWHQFAFGIAGSYLMLLGCNGGIWAGSATLTLRLALSAVTLLVFVFMSRRVFATGKPGVAS